jgi:TnpA family transposase
MVETATITGQWAEPLRLKASIQAGVVVPSVILRKLAAAGGGNALSRALRACQPIIESGRPPILR